MALSKKAKTGIVVGVGVLVALGFAGAASADVIPDFEPDDDDDEDDEDDEPVPGVIVDPITPPPPPGGFPPLPGTCDYSGCGALFDSSHAHPTVYCLQVQQLGYPIDCAVVGANGSMIAVEPQRNWVRKFQEDYNRVRGGVGLEAPVALAGGNATNALNAIKTNPGLVTDGLVGNRTIAALSRARALMLTTGIPWRNLVTLAG